MLLVAIGFVIENRCAPRPLANRYASKEGILSKNVAPTGTGLHNLLVKHATSGKFDTGLDGDRSRVVLALSRQAQKCKSKIGNGVRQPSGYDRYGKRFLTIAGTHHRV